MPAVLDSSERLKDKPPIRWVIVGGDHKLDGEIAAVIREVEAGFTGAAGDGGALAEIMRKMSVMSLETRSRFRVKGRIMPNKSLAERN